MEQSHHRGKLRNKVFIIIALVSVTPILLAGYLSIYSIKSAHKTDVANLEDAVIDQKVSEVGALLGAMIDRLRPSVISQRPDSLSAANKILLQSIFDSARESLGLQDIAFIGLEGKELARLSVLQPNGVAGDALHDKSSAPWFADVKSGKTYVSNAIAIVEGVPTIAVAAPIKDQDGSVVSILEGTYSLRVVQSAVQNVSLGKTGYLYLVDEYGKVIGSGFGGPVPATDNSAVGIVKEVIGGKDFSGPTGQSYYNNATHDEVVAAGKFIRQFGWGLIAEWPVKEADASVNELIYYKDLPILIAVIVAVVIASVLLAGLIVRPIRMLEKGTALVAEGKFDTEVRIRTNDELEDLGTAFNKMTIGLKRLEELKNEFVFVAAHELRTPVAAMKGYLTLIIQGVTGPITEKTKDFMEKVVKSNDRLAQLVNDLLEISRSEGGKLTIKVAPIDVVEPIKSVLTELQSLADKASVQMIYEPQLVLSGVERANLPKAMADADRLKEILVNLVGNSIKYMGLPKGEAGGAGKVTITHEVQDGNLVTHVADTGLGISKEAQAKLFEKFYRVATDRTKDIQGTGLGLFIVKEIVEKMNGKIWVDSEEGKGSTFSFSLPLAGS